MNADDMTSALLSRCCFPPAETLVVCAFSGGPDSTALLVLAHAAGCRVSAIHVDHGLRAGSVAEATRAVETARRIGVDCSVANAALTDGPNLEARARAARREILGVDALTGHTADDQAETMLLALLRGSGATGLAAMTPGPTKPILGLRRSETQDLCVSLDLDVITDPTNAEARFVRNRVRNEVLPMLHDVASRDVVPLLTRAADLLRDDDALLDELADAIDSTDARALTAAPRPLARRAVRRWLMRTDSGADAYPPDLQAIDRVLAVAAGEFVACQVSGHIRVERTKQRLRLFRQGDPSR